MAYSLPALPYDYAALEPHVDATTMNIHHTKHHQVSWWRTGRISFRRPQDVWTRSRGQTCAW
jgi:hypothetical protein